MIIAVIPARGGSKRIPKKNIVQFAGKPLIAHALEAAVRSDIFDKIHVSTDSDEIAEVVEKMGFSVEFRREPDLADDFTGIVPVLKWVVDKYAEMGQVYDEVCCITPAAPLLQSKDLSAAYKIFKSHHGKFPLLVFSSYGAPIEWAFHEVEAGYMKPVSSTALLKRSQDIEESYYECGPFTYWKTSHLESENPLSEGVSSYVLPRSRAIDIDTPEDLAYAEQIYNVQMMMKGSD